jgi:ABC-2 type transport system ATP-binding protein
VSAPPPPALAIEVHRLIKRFGALVAVDGLELQVPVGQCIGLLGPNGAGKTTTVEILEGLQEPTSGEVRILGLCWRADAARLRGRIGIALQETRFHERLTVEETVRLFRSFYREGLPVEEAVGLVQLQEKRSTQVGRLSGGQRQRLAIAVALVSEPELLFLDEPTTGLDPQSRRALWDVIARLRGKGRTVVLTTHYMEEAQALCDRVVIVDHGKVVADGSPAQLIAGLGGDQRIELSCAPPLEDGRLRTVPGLVAVSRGGEHLALTVTELHRAVPAVLAAVQAQGCELRALSTRQATLDDVFLAHTGRSLREEADRG